MPHLCVALLAASLMATPAILGAQQPAVNPSPDYSKPSLRVTGIGIPAVAGLPFSATVVIENARLMLDGSFFTRRTINVIARDSKGRTRNESRQLELESFHGSPALIWVRLYDPQTRLRTIYYPATHTARRQVMPAPTKTASPPPSWTSQADLGTNTLNGLEAKGVRRKYIEPGDANSGGKPVEVTDEFWYSADLHLTLLAHHTDPRMGENMAAISGLKREEPPASLFELPAGYTIVDAVPPAASPRVTDPMADELP
jgi:hypothetical protein